MTPIKSRNGKIRLEDRHFGWQADIKEEYLDTKRPSTARTIKSKLLKVDEYEVKAQKSVYDWNVEEIDDFMNSKFKILSRASASGNMSYIIGYIDYCISKNLVRHRENRFKILSTSDRYKFVSPHAQSNKYLTKEERNEVEEKLLNACDKLIMEIVPLGVRGRTQQGNTCEELINLRNEDIDFNERKMTLRNNDGDERILYNLSDHVLNLLKETIESRFYKTYKKAKNSDEIVIKTMIINPTDYVFRTAGKNKSGKVKSQFFTSRLNQAIKEACGNSYINLTNLYFSGIIEYAKQLREEKGSNLEFVDYGKILDKFYCGEPTIITATGEIYWGNVISKVKRMVVDYFKAKGEEI